MKSKKNVLARYIIPGSRVDLQEMKRLADEDDENVKRKVYQTQVIDLVSDNRIEIAIPMEKTKLIMLPVNSVYDLCFFSGTTLYQCYGRVVDRYKSNNLYIMLIELVSSLRRQQRREYFRFSCMMEMDSRVLQEEEIQAIEQNGEAAMLEMPLQKSTVVDISGGGLRFVANFTYEAGSLIWCKYQLGNEGEGKEYRLVGKVLSVRELENRWGIYEHRIQYVNVDDEDREEIIKYIFGQERKVLSKQKGK